MNKKQPMALSSVLIVEDVFSLAETYAAFLRNVGFHCQITGTGEEAVAILTTSSFDVVILDINLPDISGLEVMRTMKRRGSVSQFIVITADASITVAVDVMRNGANDFLVKPFNAERIRTCVKNAFDRVWSNSAIAEEKKPNQFGGFIGKCEPMQKVFKTLKCAAPSLATVFITGASGTGKELCAEILHGHSKRSKGPLITLNCAAIPKDLLESEIFGHAKGAFTGATSERNGAALQADGGTLFLDEICELDLALQSKLLRFLQTKQVQRLGEDRLRSSDVRIVCATNRHPQTEVKEGRFREDLFYRLHVIPVEMPSLSVRGADIMLLAHSFLKTFAKEEQKSFSGFSLESMDVLTNFTWPGNVRQLQNIIRNIVVLHEGGDVSVEMLPGELQVNLICDSNAVNTNVDTSSLRLLLEKSGTSSKRSGIIKPLEETIRQAVERAVDHFDGSIPRAAAALDVSPSTLYRRIEVWRHSEAA